MFYIVGNGPSVTESMISNLPDNRWLGMNSAYKYWSKINKYPRYYCCLDPVVVKSHADAIHNMVCNTEVQKFFLHEEFFDCYPNLKGSERIVSRSDFLANKGCRIGFSRLSLQKQTTGALATRFAIEQGHDNLILIGVDCNYIEVINEAESSGGIELVVNQKVKKNPNYFFADYQSPGDKYQVPNPEQHSGNLHLQSFVALKNDIDFTEDGINVYVGVEQSLLAKNSIFPFNDYWKSIGHRRLQCVAVPITVREVDTFLGNVNLWLDSRFYPTVNPTAKGTVLHVFLDQAHDNVVYEKLKSGLQRHLGLGNVFDEIKITFCNLPSEVNFYKKAKDGNKEVNKSGPNIFFLAVMAHCRKYAFTFQMESDCIPLKAGWIDALDNECCSSGINSWIIGPEYFGPSRLRSSYCAHINGNAIYKTGDSGFVDFIDELFVPLLKEFISRGLYDLAYDTLLSVLMFNIDSIEPCQKERLLSSFAMLKYTNTIVNLGGGVETQNYSRLELSELIRSKPETFLLHGRWGVSSLLPNKTRIPRLYQKPALFSRCELPFSHIWAAKDVSIEAGIKGYGNFSIKCSSSKTNCSLYFHYIWMGQRQAESAELNFASDISGEHETIRSCSFLIMKEDRNYPIESEFSKDGASFTVKARLDKVDQDIKYLIIKLDIELSENNNVAFELDGANVSSYFTDGRDPSFQVVEEELSELACDRVSSWQEFVIGFAKSWSK